MSDHNGNLEMRNSTVPTITKTGKSYTLPEYVIGQYGELVMED
jgi:hypothetical protein